MSPVVDLIAPGDRLHAGLDGLFAKHGLQAGRAHLSGALQHVDLVAAPDAAPIAIVGPLCLVSASVTVDSDALRIYGTVSWSDRGLPRLAGGVLDDAVSAGVEVVLEAWSEAAVAAPPPPRKERPKPPPAKPRPERPARPKVEAPEDPQVDLSAEIAELTPKPAPAPAPTPAPAPSGGGWAAAVAASRAPTPATASDLGFDVDGPPDLVSGDTIVHPRFGRCRVIKPQGTDKVRLRRPSGAFFDLKLSICTFARLSDEGGKRVFSVKVGR